MKVERGVKEMSDEANLRERPARRASPVSRAFVWLVAFAYAVLWVGGGVSHFARGGVRAEQEWVGSLFLLLAGTLTVAGAHGARSRWWLASFALIGFAAEVCGVRFGVPFGAYRYTDALQPQLFGVPLVIALAWMTLAAYVKQMLRYFNLPRVVESLIGATWLTIIDLVIDPLAAGPVGYWHWASAGYYYDVPAANFAGWFAVSFFAFVLWRQQSEPNAWARFAGASVVLFFTLLSAAHAMYAAALVGVALCLVDGFAHLISVRRGVQHKNDAEAMHDRRVL